MGSDFFVQVHRLTAVAAIDGAAEKSEMYDATAVRAAVAQEIPNKGCYQNNSGNDDPQRTVAGNRKPKSDSADNDSDGCNAGC